MRQEIENRISRRSFLNEPLTEQQRQEIGAYIREQNAVSQLTVSFLEDGSCAFGNIKTTYGMFSNVRSMLLLKGMADMPDLKEKIGSYGEDLALFLTGMGLGTCWVGGTYDKEALDVRPDEELVCVLLVGKVKKASVKEKLLRSTLRGKVKEYSRADDRRPADFRSGSEMACRRFCLLPAPGILKERSFILKMVRSALKLKTTTVLIWSIWVLRKSTLKLKREADSIGETAACFIQHKLESHNQRKPRPDRIPDEVFCI